MSNELTYKYPGNYLIICREKGDEMKCSLRSAKYEVRDKLVAALVGIEGTGGGHSHACGANIKIKDFDRFIEQFKDQIENQSEK